MTLAGDPAREGVWSGGAAVNRVVCGKAGAGESGSAGKGRVLLPARERGGGGDEVGGGPSSLG